MIRRTHKYFTTSSIKLARIRPQRIKNLQEVPILSPKPSSDLGNDIIEDANANWFIKPQDQKITQKIDTSVFSNIPSTVTKDAALSLKDAIDELLNLNAVNLSVIDLSNKCSWTSAMVVCEGASVGHVNRITEGFYLFAKEKIRKVTHECGDGNKNAEKRLVVEGESGEEWRLIDLGGFVVHVFTSEAREQYDLEGLWSSVEEFK